jgi:hypothetical protein
LIITRRGKVKGPPGSEPPPSDTKPKSWAERWQEIRAAFHNVPKAFGLVWQAHRGAAIVMAFVALFTGLIPISQAWVAKSIRLWPQLPAAWPPPSPSRPPSPSC